YQAQPVWWNDRRTGRKEQAVLLRRIPGNNGPSGSLRYARIRSNCGDEGGRLYGLRVARLQCGPRVHLERSVCEQPYRSVALQRGSGEAGEQTSGFGGSVRKDSL